MWKLTAHVLIKDNSHFAFLNYKIYTRSPSELNFTVLIKKVFYKLSIFKMKENKALGALCGVLQSISRRFIEVQISELESLILCISFYA